MTITELITWHRARRDHYLDEAQHWAQIVSKVALRRSTGAQKKLQFHEDALSLLARVTEAGS